MVGHRSVGGQGGELLEQGLGILGLVEGIDQNQHAPLIVLQVLLPAHGLPGGQQLVETRDAATGQVVGETKSVAHTLKQGGAPAQAAAEE